MNGYTWKMGGREMALRDCSFIDIKMLNWRAAKEARVFELGCLSSPRNVSSGKSKGNWWTIFKRGCTSLSKFLNEALVMNKDNMGK